MSVCIGGKLAGRDHRVELPERTIHYAGVAPELRGLPTDNWHIRQLGFVQASWLNLKSTCVGHSNQYSCVVYSLIAQPYSRTFGPPTSDTLW